MAECEWIALCDYAFQGQHGKLGLIGIFDVILTRRAAPITHPRASIGFNVFGEPGERVQMALEIIGPSGQPLVKANADLTLPDAGSAHAHIDLQDLLLPEFGRYAIQIDLGEGIPKTAWFTLKQLPE